MADKTLNTIIVLRNDKSTDWADSTVILREGELGVSYLDNGNVMVKAGNGVDKWADLAQVESVLENDMLLTYSFGKHTVPTGSYVNAGGKNMTFSEWFADSLKKAVEPTISSYPNVSLTAGCGNTGASLEIGSYITSVSYEGKLSAAGAYNVNGKSVGSGLDNDDVSWKITLGSDVATEKSTRTGSYTVNTQINSTSEAIYATVNATATLSVADVTIPTNNLGESRPDAKIKGFDAAGSLTKTLSADVKVTGYRNTWYYVGTDCTTTLDSDFLRTAKTGLTAKNANTTSFGTVTIPAGTKRVVFAVLGDKTLKSVIDVDGQGLDVKANFTKEIVGIQGANGFEAANYSVFHFENENGVAATKYTVTIA